MSIEEWSKIIAVGVGQPMGNVGEITILIVWNIGQSELAFTQLNITLLGLLVSIVDLAHKALPSCTARCLPCKDAMTSMGLLNGK